MSISPKKRIIKKIGNAHIIWFEESNSWIQFEDPAWFVYLHYNSGEEPEKISQRISKKYKLNGSESLKFVHDIVLEIRKLTTSSFHSQEIFSAQKFVSPENFYSVHRYRFKSKIFEILFGSRLLEYMIHPSLAHLEMNRIIKPHFRLEAFTSGSSTLLKIADKAWVEEDANLLKRRIFIEISGLLYGKSDKGWLSFIHGSAVSNGKQTIILSTESGSGKSTLAALLSRHGFKFVADDYVPIDARLCKAWPFPAALSVKDGAYNVLPPFYPELDSAREFHFKGSKKTLKYIPFPNDGDFYKPLPVRALVFVKYKPGSSFSFRKVPALEALKRFNEEAWVSHSPEHARKFIRWFPSLECFEMEYSDNQLAIKQISGLFWSS